MENQLNLGYALNDLERAKTKKKEFLSQMDKLIPWGKWVHLVKPCYYKGEHGNKPYEIELMLRLYVLQNLYNLSDMAVAAEVVDSRAFSDFCRISSPEEVPDGDTIGRFRNILIENHLQKKFFDHVVKLLEEKGLILKKGTIVDSTLISAPSSTKNKERERDPEAHSTKKGNNFHFGYKAHIGVDKDTGLVHHLETTAANVHDVTVTQELLSGEETAVYGDSGYLGADKREGARRKNVNGERIRYHLNRRPSQSKNNTVRSKAQIKRRETEKSSVRAKVEHVFGVVKGLFGYRKTRYRGLRKQEAQQNMVFALANLYLAGKRFSLA